ncbi:MAG: cytidine deaminase [Bacillota bacterium]|nr:cytidine deaminase [Bacillota bacterium]
MNFQPEQLYDIAKTVSVNAYAPYSKFKVGAALLTEDGRVYSGVNIENSSYGATICAERTAFVKAISEGEKHFTAIAVYAEGEEAIPCGICRQFMYEFAPELMIITGKTREEINVRSLNELLPVGFSLKGEDR